MTHQRNRYAGTCYRCAAPVPAQEGFVTFVALPSMVWPRAAGLRNLSLVEHEECHVRFKGTTRHWQFNPEDGQ